MKKSEILFLYETSYNIPNGDPFTGEQRYDEETKKIYDSYMNDALETVKRNDSLEEKKAEKLWEEIQNKQKSAHIKLQSDYEQNCDKWVDAIVSRTLE